MSSVIGSLRVNLSASSAELDAGLQQAITKLAAFGEKAKVETTQFAQAFLKAGDDAGAGLEEKLGGAVDGVKSSITAKLMDLASKAGPFGKLASLLGPQIAEMVNAAEKEGALLANNFLFKEGNWAKISTGVAELGATVLGTFDLLSNRILAWRQTLVDAWNSGTNIFESIGKVALQALTAPWEMAKKGISDWLGQIGAAWSNSSGVFDGIKAALWAAFVQPIKDGMTAIYNWVSAIKEAYTSADGFVSGLSSALKAAITAPMDESTKALALNSAAAKEWEKTIKEKMDAAGTAIDRFTQKRAGIFKDKETPEEAEKPEVGSGYGQDKDTLEKIFLDLEKKIDLIDVEYMTLGKLKGETAAYKAEVEALHRVKQMGMELDAGQKAALDDEIQRLRESTNALEEKKRVMKELNEVTGVFKNAFVGAIDMIVEGSWNGKKALQSLLKDFSRMLANTAFMRLFGGGGSPGAFDLAGLFGGLFGGMKANGGPISGDKMYIAGEKGPEPIFPGRNGFVMNNRMANETFGGGGSPISISLSLDARGADASVVQRLEAQMERMKAEMRSVAVSAVRDARERNRGL